MMQFPGRFLILIGMAVGAVCNLQSSAAIADNPPTVADTSWGCDWTASCGDKTESGTVHGFNTEDEASAAATQAAIDSCIENCATSPCAITVGEPYQERPVVAPGVDSKDAATQPLSSSGLWKVAYRCTSRNGHSLEMKASGSTFCEAVSAARNRVCGQMSNPYFGGACRCCYQVLERPCCCHSCSCCR